MNNGINKGKKYVIMVVLCFCFLHAGAQYKEDILQSYLFATPKFGLKTNLVYLAGVLPDFSYYTPIPNLEFEWHVAKRWSIAATGAYAKWGTGKNREFGISSWSIEGRYWFELYEKIIDRVYVGVYGMMGDFDKKGYGSDPLYNNKTGDFGGGGLSAGILMPFNDRWALEVGARAGFRYTETDSYCDQDPDFYRDNTTYKTKFNLQGLKVAIVYRFGFFK